jgi:hypothetical protein
MTWKLTVRSNPGSTVRADYECPVHGRFTLDVVRDEKGDPPDVVACTFDSWSVAGGDKEYATREDAVQVALEAGYSDPETAFYETQRCGDDCPHVMSPPGAVRVKPGEMVRGKSDARPADKHVMDTSKIADGMPYDQWKAERAGVHRDESLRRVRKAFGYGPRTWVGGRR